MNPLFSLQNNSDLLQFEFSEKIKEAEKAKALAALNPSEQIAFHVCYEDTNEIEDLINKKKADPSIQLTIKATEIILKVTDRDCLKADGFTALHLACKISSGASIKCLLVFVKLFPQMLHIKNSLGRTPLHTLALNDESFGAQQIAELVENGGNLFELDRQDLTPFNYIVQSKALEVIKSVFTKVAPILASQLASIIREKILDNLPVRVISIVTGYLKVPQMVDYLEYYQARSPTFHRTTLMHSAAMAKGSHIERINFLLSEEVDPCELYAVQPNGKIPLEQLAEQDQTAIITWNKPLYDKCHQEYYMTAVLSFCATVGSLEGIKHHIEIMKVNPFLLVNKFAIVKMKELEISENAKGNAYKLELDLDKMLGKSAFHFACAAAQETIIRYFVDKFPNIIRVYASNSPFSELVKGKCSEELIEYFLDHGVNFLESTDDFTNTLFGVLVENDKVSIKLDTLVKWLLRAAKEEDAQKFTPNYSPVLRKPIDFTVVGGRSLLGHFAHKGNLKSVIHLLELGGEPYLKDMEYLGNEEIRILLKGKINEKREKECPASFLPLYAYERRDKEFIDLIKAKGVDAVAPLTDSLRIWIDENASSYAEKADLSISLGVTPLHLACAFGRIELIEFLIGYYKDKDLSIVVDSDKNTVLHYLAAYPWTTYSWTNKGNWQEILTRVLEILIKCKAFPTANNKGETPFHFAARHGKEVFKAFKAPFEFLSKAKEASEEYKEEHKEKKPLRDLSSILALKNREDRIAEYYLPPDGYGTQELQSDQSVQTMGLAPSGFGF
ncbi:MAG: ankyrin repeat domain-containing protein [Parachlamydiaceae bacterium]|nr:ankyrin repeat domain-containing protein [Parachlamydiaceae bacterium]